MLKKKKYRNFKSERLLKDRASEPIEVRLLREGKLRERRREQMAKEKCVKPKGVRSRRRVQSSMEGPREIIRDNKGKVLEENLDLKDDAEVYVTESENKQFLISTS